MRFAELKAHLLANGDEVGEEHGIAPFVLIFRKDGHEQQIYDVRMLEEQRLDQMVPTEGEQAALGFLLSLRAGRHTHPPGSFYDRDQPHVYERKVSVDVLGDLPLVHFGITVQWGVCVVDYVENLGSPSSSAYFAGAFEFAYVKVVAFGAHFRHAEIFVHVCLMIAVGDA